MHIESEKNWMDYLEEKLVETERNKVEKHLADCSECLEFYQRMQKTESSLRQAGVAIGQQITIPENQVSNSLAKVLARILDSEAKNQQLNINQVQERLDQLAEILAVMCGSWTAVNALRVAAESTIANTPENLTTETWIPFLKQLKKIASVFCGDAGAKLVWEYGQL